MRRVTFLALLPLAACQTSIATRVMPPTPETALVGVPYAIPALRYDLTIMRTLTNCEEIDPRGGSGDRSSLNVEFETKATSKASHVTGERYVVDYRALSSWSKSTAFKMTLNENQTLKSFNAEAEDHGPEIAASLVKTGFTVAKMISGLPAVAAAPVRPPTGADEPRSTCPAALKFVEDLSGAMEAQTKELKQKTVDLDGLIVAGAVGTLSEAEKERAATLRTETKALMKSTGDLQAKIDGWKSELTFTETAAIDPRFGREPEAIPFPSKNPAVSARQTAWLKSMFGVQTDAATLTHIAGRLGLIVPTVTVAAGATVSCNELGLGDCAPTSAPNWSAVRGDAYRPYVPAGAEPSAAPGIVVRMPVQTVLRVCQEFSEAPADVRQAPAALRDETTMRSACETGSPTVRVLVADAAAAAQLGPRLVLPLTNGFGQNNSLEATFRADGALETVAYGSKGGGTQITSLLATTVDEAAAYQAAEQARRKVNAEVAASATTNALDQQIAVAKKQKELADAVAALDPDPGAAGKQAQAELDAKVARLEAEKKIKELEAALQQYP